MSTINFKSPLTVAAVSVVLLLFLSTGGIGMMVANATSTGLTFTAIQNLTPSDPGASTAPVVASVGSHVYVAWEEKTSSSHALTEFRMSSDGGTTWGSIIQFSGLPGSANTQLDAVQIAASGNYVYLTWKQGGGTAFAASSDSGQTFHCGSASGACIISGGAPSGKDTAQAISATGANAYVTWNDQTSTSELIEEVTTNDGGVTLTTPVVLNTSPAPSGFAEEDESAAVGNYVYVVWDSIWISVNPDNGNPTMWSTPKQLCPSSCVFPVIGREPMISASGTNVYVTFPEGCLGGGCSYSTMIAVSHDNGQTFASAKSLSSGLSNTREVQVASYGSDVIVTSRGTGGGVGGTQQYVYVSTDSGNTFGSPVLLASPNGQSGGENGFGSVVFDQTNGNVFAYWPHGTPSQMFVDTSQDSGSTWAGVQQVSLSTGGIILLGDPGGSQGPMVAASNGHVYFAWEDTSSGNGDIYFRSA